VLGVRISGPGGWLGLGIMFDEEAIDGGLQIDDRDEDTAFYSSLGEFYEKPSTALSHRTRREREVECEALVAVEPSPHIGMLGRRSCRGSHVRLCQLAPPLRSH
jgi:hypothetical protein